MRDEQTELAWRECLGKSIAEHRDRKKLTQADLAQKIGLKYGSNISELENGKKRISTQQLLRISKELHVPVLDVVDWAFLQFRKKIAALVGDGDRDGDGFLLRSPSVTRDDVKSRFALLTGQAGEVLSLYLHFAHPPTDTEVLRSNLREETEEEDPAEDPSFGPEEE